MANTKSAKKHIRVNKRNHTKNISHKSSLKNATKKYLNLLKNYKNEPNYENYILSKNSLTVVFSYIDKAKKKNILHKNNAARKKSRLNKKIENSSET